MVRRVLLPAAWVAVILVFPLLDAHATCRVNQIIGLWKRENESARLRFFSHNKLECRLCDPKVTEGCRFIYDPADDQGRKQCPFSHPGGKTTTLSGWTARDGMLDRLTFADGTSIPVGNGCHIDGKAGTMRIEGLGTFTCDYEYHCRKLSR